MALDLDLFVLGTYLVSSQPIRATGSYHDSKTYPPDKQPRQRPARLSALFCPLYPSPNPPGTPQTRNPAQLVVFAARYSSKLTPLTGYLGPNYTPSFSTTTTTSNPNLLLPPSAPTLRSTSLLTPDLSLFPW